VVNAILLRPLPYNDADRLVVVSESWPARSLSHIGVAPDTFADWQERNHVFADMAAFANGEVALTEDGEPEKVASQSVTPNLFALIGAGAALGHSFIPDDIKPGQPRVVLISHSLWHRRFNGDPSVIGRKLKITLAVPEEAIIVGVMPAGFQWGVTIGKPVDLWTPFMGLHALTKGHSVWQGRYLTAVARLKPGVSVAQAQAEMAAITAWVANQYPSYHAELSATVTPLRERLYGDLRPALAMLLGASAGLLLAKWGADLIVSLSPPYLLNLESVRISAPATARAGYADEGDCHRRELFSHDADSPATRASLYRTGSYRISRPCIDQ
jgi:putative ABC transport system permease protein